jgi:hypothetical protein
MGSDAHANSSIPDLGSSPIAAQALP